MLLSLTGQKHTFFEKKDVQDLLWSEPSSLVRLISHGSACSWVVDSWHIGRYRQKCHHASNFLIEFPLPRRATYSTPASNFALFFLSSWNTTSSLGQPPHPPPHRKHMLPILAVTEVCSDSRCISPIELRWVMDLSVSSRKLDVDFSQQGLCLSSQNITAWHRIGVQECLGANECINCRISIRIYCLWVSPSRKWLDGSSLSLQGMFGKVRIKLQPMQDREMSKNRENYLWFLNTAPNKNCKKWRWGIDVELALKLALPLEWELRWLINAPPGRLPRRKGSNGLSNDAALLWRIVC